MKGLSVSLSTLFAGFDRCHLNLTEVAEYLATRAARDVRSVWRVGRALFDKG